MWRGVVLQRAYHGTALCRAVDLNRPSAGQFRERPMTTARPARDRGWCRSWLEYGPFSYPTQHGTRHPIVGQLWARYGRCGVRLADGVSSHIRLGSSGAVSRAEGCGGERAVPGDPLFIDDINTEECSGTVLGFSEFMSSLALVWDMSYILLIDGTRQAVTCVGGGGGHLNLPC